MRANNHVSELTRRAAFTTINLAVEDDSSAHTLGRENGYEISSTTDFRPPKPQFSESNGIRVIVNRYRQTSCGRYRLRHWKIPPFEVRHINRRPC